MTNATITAFDSTLHKTNVWLKELQEELDWKPSDHQKTYHALRAVLHVLRDRLTPQEASDFAAQLPMLIRGFYYEGWNPSRTPTSDNREEMLAKIAEHFETDASVEAETITRAVFKVVQKHVSEGEVEDIKAALPKSIRELWG